MRQLFETNELKLPEIIEMKQIGSLFIILLLIINGCSNDDNSGSPTQPDNQPQSGEYYIDIYDQAKACQGTTLFTDSHEADNLRVVEVDMEGQIVWEFTIPQEWIRGQTVGFDAERLDTGNTLIVLSTSGLYEIDRDGNLVWQHADPNCSHDADRLNSGNTIFVFGNNDAKEHPCIKEVDSQGRIVWRWFARDHYDIPPYDVVDYQGWTHANGVTRIESSQNTMISLRNFDMTVIVDAQGIPIWELDWPDLYPVSNWQGLDPHEPEIHSDGSLLVCLQWEAPFQIVEIDTASRQPQWEYHRDNLRTCRDSDRLPNGNVLVVGVMTDIDESIIFEISPEKEIVWQLRLYDTPIGTRPGHFYKAQRIVSDSG